MSLAEIRLATMGFDRNRIVGEGASATVYKIRGFFLLVEKWLTGEGSRN